MGIPSNGTGVLSREYSSAAGAMVGRRSATGSRSCFGFVGGASGERGGATNVSEVLIDRKVGYLPLALPAQALRPRRRAMGLKKSFVDQLAAMVCSILQGFGR